MKEIRFHGRGGQGAVTAASLLAMAAGDEGKYSQAFPFFGVERRGAPVTSFCRISDEPIKIHQYIYKPDIVVVLDPSLLGKVDVCEGLKEGGIVIVNSKERISLPTKNAYFVDASGIAIKHIGKPIVNTAMLGAFAKVTNLVHIDGLKKAIGEVFKGELAEKNIRAIEECYSGVV
ncbi:MAG: pyruvate ferredoxin oxidoreductase subunit gamma [Candidatus Micrarchaeia archaeon]